ncbi:TetR/AcrR family transcriptional regulator [Bacillus horti]|uniref:TetR/AcrR family fatty acid metabolism transcriptional regulator n=1 Tax=Caldalkalibacillus horti TaxID=77523 RepID=A0ABT9W051_9BACI|nr:TetR/AcrR family transcriptional regulator [Bacillus horti]MDQ0166628.1 TetR/AcrR family fatty acid metabolism transcriptional regulator [Bacillus horti]
MNTQAGDKVNQILDAAFQVFGTQGFYETKMSEIAEQAGIAKGTIYLYFSSKEELYKAMTERDFQRYLEELHKVVSSEGSFEELLTRIGRHHFYYYLERKEYTRVFFQSPNNDPNMWKMLRAFLQEYVSLIEQLMQRERLQAPHDLALVFSGLLDSFKMEILHSPEMGKEQVEKRISFLVQLFLKGCYELSE